MLWTCYSDYTYQVGSAVVPYIPIRLALTLALLLAKGIILWQQHVHVFVCWGMEVGS